MTTFVEEGNTVGWATHATVGTRDTDVTVLPNGLTLSFMGNHPITSNLSVDKSSIMPNPGKFVSLVYHCEDNTALLDTIVEARINNVVITGMKIIISSGESGYFFVGQNLSEAAREFVRGDRIMINVKKDASEATGRGTIQATVMACIEIEFPPVPP